MSMKFEIERVKLIEALEPVSRLAKKNASMEILAHTLITASEGKISVRGTNLDTFMSKLVKAEVEEIGQCTADAKKLLAMLKADRSEVVGFEMAASDRLQVSTEHATAKLAVMDTEEYPVFDENIKFWFDIEPESLIRDMACVQNASASGKGAQAFLETVFVETRGGKLLIAAADGKCILRVEKEIVADDKKALMPNSVPALLSGSIGGESVIIGTSGENDNLICFHTDECHVSSRLYEGDFPDIDAILKPHSSKHDTTLTFLRADMEYAASVIKPVTSGVDKPVVKMRLEGDKLHIGHRNDSGSIVTDMPVQNVNGDDFAFFWQLDYMAKTLAGMSQHDEIYMGFTNSLSPVYFRNAGDGTTYGLVMPVKNVSWMEDL